MNWSPFVIFHYVIVFIFLSKRSQAFHKTKYNAVLEIKTEITRLFVHFPLRGKAYFIATLFYQLDRINPFHRHLLKKSSESMFSNILWFFGLAISFYHFGFLEAQLPSKFIFVTDSLPHGKFSCFGHISVVCGSIWTFLTILLSRI